MRVAIWTGVLAVSWAGVATGGEFERFAIRKGLIQKADVIVLGEVTHVVQRESARKMLRKKQAQTWPVTILPSAVLKGEVPEAPVVRVRVSGAGNYLDACGEDRPVRRGDTGAWYFLRDEDGLHLEAFVHVDRTRAYLSKTSRHKDPTVAQALACEQATVERYLYGLACSAARRAFANAPRPARKHYARAQAALEAYREAERAFLRAYAPRREHEQDYLLQVMREPTRKLAKEARRKGLEPSTTR